MNKDKHVLPRDMDTYPSRIRNDSEGEKLESSVKTIYGPNNEPLAKVDTDIANRTLE